VPKRTVFASCFCSGPCPPCHAKIELRIVLAILKLSILVVIIVGREYFDLEHRLRIRNDFRMLEPASVCRRQRDWIWRGLGWQKQGDIGRECGCVGDEVLQGPYGGRVCRGGRIERDG
jgi:hypothetical protein